MLLDLIPLYAWAPMVCKYLISRYCQFDHKQYMQPYLQHVISYDNYQDVSIANTMENTDRLPISYTVTYSDISQSGRICDSTTILASSCLNETCCHTFGVISPPCSSSGDISISVFATSILGDGPPSTPLIFIK